MPPLKTGLSACGMALAALIMTCYSPPAAPDLADPAAAALVRSLDAALNAHDSQTVVNMFAPDAAVQEDRRPQSSEQIRGWVDELIRQQVRVELIEQPWVTHVDVPRRGTSVTWPARLDMQTYRDMGLDFVPAYLRATVVDGRVAFLSIRPDDNWNSALDRTSLT
jgi:hypothetical protein